ncbi:MAG: AEC family transporter [Clostridiales Family XIII bacterium]|jgi:predicted permease|nr:AEC family transporter [Clostridiales Family XIII bacterium]
MESFVLAAKAVFPMFFWILLGFGIKNLFHISDEAVRKGNKIVFTFLLPIAIFNNVTAAHIGSVVQPVLIVFTASSIFIIWGCTWKYIKATEPDRTKHGALIQGIFRSNFVLFGMPLVSNIYSTGSAGVTSFMVAIVVPIFNLLAIFTLETNRRDRAPGRMKVRSLLVAIAKNPLIIGSVVGIVFLFAAIPIPEALRDPLNLFSRASTQIALFIMGGAFTLKNIATDRKRLVKAVSLKLVFWPFLVISAAVLIGFRDVELATILSFAAAPSAINSYTMADIMGNDGPLAAAIVVFTTLFAAVTVFLFVFGLSSLGFIGRVN